MSAIDTLKGKMAPKAPSAVNAVDDITARLKTAEDELSRLTAAYDQKALDIVLAGGDIAPVNRALAEAQGVVSTLRAALKGADAARAAEIQRTRISLQQTQIRSMNLHMSKRNTAATALVAAIKETADQYKKLVDHSLKARAAGEAVGRVIGFSWPDEGSFSGDLSLERLLAGEFYRQSATPGNKENYALPGAHYPSLETQWNPQAIPPLDEQVKTAGANILAKFKAPE
jgi:multidrug efflux pump subunit AcrA (membrane-fusion protein)